ncbi:MAG: hypothetical protein ABI193_09635 [Minicystis sp.]
MATTNIREHRGYGQAVLDRLAGTPIPPMLKPSVTAFTKTHGAYDAAAVLTDSARAKRDLALDLIGDIDDTFDIGANGLADKVVGAGLGKRQSPFAGLSKHSPSQLVSLPYAEEPKAIRALITALQKKNPPAEVKKAIARCLKDATALEGALGKLTQPQAAFAKAIATRDALLPAWTKALRSLKRQAAAVWDEDEATYKAVFAPVGAVQAPKKKTKKTPAKKAGSDTGGAPGQPG